MNKQDIIDTIKEGGHSKVKVAIVDIDGVLRGKYMHRDKFLSSLESGFGFCNVVFGWDVSDVLYDQSELTGWHSGFPDVEAYLDPKTFREIPWEDSTPFVLGDFSNDAGVGFPACPRSLLKRMIAKAEAMNVKPVFAQEFEWYNYKIEQTNTHRALPDSAVPLTDGMFGYSILRASENSAYFHDLFDLMEAFGIPIEGLHTETGPGVYEAAIQYTDILEAADRAALFKTSVKEIAKKHGVIASFMAKPSSDLPGCSGHVHQSLWNMNQSKNLFFDSKAESKMSSTMKHYMAGQLNALPEVLPMYAPTINSYKRLVEGAWAPTTLTWGIDNRTTALRALPVGEKSTRLETRVVGSDVNPYLAIAACLASGLYGIENELPLSIQSTIGNGYDNKKDGVLPTNLKEATDAMRNSTLAADLFGKPFVDHFCESRDWEWRSFSREVTNWEMKRYFEII